MKQSHGQYANSGEISKAEELIVHPTGREGTPFADRDALAMQEIEGPPATLPADAHHDVGSGEEETPDGLDAEAEAVRRAAEEGALEGRAEEDIPIFDWAERAEVIRAMLDLTKSRVAGACQPNDAATAHFDCLKAVIEFSDRCLRLKRLIFTPAYLPHARPQV